MTIIPKQESLTCEFKSDRKCLPDRELIEGVYTPGSHQTLPLNAGQAHKLTKQLCKGTILEKQGFRKDLTYQKR